MKYLIWSLINTALVIYFFVICYRAVKLIKEKFGVVTAVFFTIGLLSFACQSNNEDKNTHQREMWTFNTDTITETSTIRMRNCYAEKSPSFQINVSVTYGLDKRNKQNVPINAYSTVSGLVSGFKWRPNSISVYKSKKETGLDCAMAGILEWQLFGLTIYSQSKALSGFIETK